jgi:hypothetical protein
MGRPLTPGGRQREPSLARRCIIDSAFAHNRLSAALATWSSSPWLRWCGACSGASRRRASPTSSVTYEKKATCKLCAVPSLFLSLLHLRLHPDPFSILLLLLIPPRLVYLFIRCTLVFYSCGSDGLISSVRFQPVRVR